MARKPTYEELEQRVRELEKEALGWNQAEEQLALFRRFTETSGQGLGMADLEGYVIYANPTLCEFMGEESPEDPIGKHVRTYYSKEDLPRLENKILPAVFKEGQKTAEIPLVSRKGELIHTIQNVFLIRNDKGDPVCLANVITDITERKKAENELQKHRDRLEGLVAERTEKLRKANEALRQEINERGEAELALRISEEQFRALVESSSDHIFMLGRDGIYLASNARVEQFGIDGSESLVGRHLMDVYPPDVASFYQKQLEKVFATGQAVKFNHSMPEPDEHRYHMDTLYPISKDDKVWAVGGICHDITEQVRMNKALQESEAYLKSILMAAPIGIGLVRNRVLQWTNDQMHQMVGYSEGELVGKSARIVYESDEEFTRVGTVEYAQIAEGGVGEVETRLLRKDGKVTDVHLRSAAIDPADLSKGVIFAATDITRRKETERALQQSEAKYRHFIEDAPIGMCILSIDGKLMYGNKKLAEMTGHRIENWMGKEFLPLVHPHDLSVVMEKIQQGLDGVRNRGPYEIRIFDGSGEIMWVTLTSRNIYEIRDGVENLVGFQTFVEDVTDRKRAEDALNESLSQYRSLFENTGTATVVVEEDMTISRVNTKCVELIGYGKDEVEGKLKFTECISEKDIERTKGFHFARRSGDGYVPSQYEFEIIDKHGTVKNVLVQVGMIPGTKQSIASVIDLSAQKQAEDALRDSEERYRTLIDTAREGVWVVDSETRTTFVNKQMTEILGYTVAEMVGRKVPEFLDEENQSIFKQKVERRLKGYSEQYDLKFLRKDGTALWTIINAAPIIDTEGQVVGSFAMITDVTARKEAVDALQQSEEQLRALASRLQEVEEAERKRLARGLHDSVGQSLTALNINLNIMRNQLSVESSTKIAPRLDDSARLVEEATNSIRDVMAELRPQVLDDYGLGPALRWYSELFERRTGITTVIHVNEMSFRMSETIESALFRVVQEALTNVAKHAKASQVVLELERTDRLLRLIITDDGIGFDSGSVKRSKEKTGWGLLTMQERAQALGGHLNIASNPGKGTRIVVEL